jgi:hypothetical protein
MTIQMHRYQKIGASIHVVTNRYRQGKNENMSWVVVVICTSRTDGHSDFISSFRTASFRLITVSIINIKT